LTRHVKGRTDAFDVPFHHEADIPISGPEPSPKVHSAIGIGADFSGLKYSFEYVRRSSVRPLHGGDLAEDAFSRVDFPERSVVGFPHERSLGRFVIHEPFAVRCSHRPFLKLSSDERAFVKTSVGTADFRFSVAHGIHYALFRFRSVFERESSHGFVRGFGARLGARLGAGLGMRFGMRLGMRFRTGSHVRFRFWRFRRFRRERLPDFLDFL
jgi:hypothetical protein